VLDRDINNSNKLKIQNKSSENVLDNSFRRKIGKTKQKIERDAMREKECRRWRCGRSGKMEISYPKYYDEKRKLLLSNFIAKFPEQ
jgi:hypothetical protein